MARALLLPSGRSGRCEGSNVRTVQLVACAAMLTLSGVSHGAVLLSDNFNGENGGSAALNYAGFANWNVTDGTVDLIGNGAFDFYPGNGLYVDLDGSTGNAGILTSKTTFSLSPGVNYTLSFRLGGSTRGDSNGVTVSVGSAFSEIFTLASSAPLSLYTRQFTVSSATAAALSISNAGGDNLGLILDDVLFESSAPTSVPEPGTLGLLGLALSGVGFARRRRN